MSFASISDSSTSALAAEAFFAHWKARSSAPILITAGLAAGLIALPLPGQQRGIYEWQIARDLGIKIVEQQIPRESLYIADEVFFTGTAAEVTPIRSVDKISVGKGVIGPMTKSIQQEFYGIVRGEKSDRHNWLTPVPVGSKQPVEV